MSTMNFVIYYTQWILTWIPKMMENWISGGVALTFQNLFDMIFLCFGLHQCLMCGVATLQPALRLIGDVFTPKSSNNSVSTKKVRKIHTITTLHMFMYVNISSLESLMACPSIFHPSQSLSAWSAWCCLVDGWRKICHDLSNGQLWRMLLLMVRKSC